jgi:type I restriction enzyme R subunit
VNKKDLTEADIRTKFITPAILAAGWDLMTQLREEAYFTKGRVMVRGKTVAPGEANKADYLLFYKPNLPIAVIEAKDNNHTAASGLAQALEYADILVDQWEAQLAPARTTADHLLSALVDELTAHD